MKKIFLVLQLFFCSLAFGQVNLNLGLKAYYPFTGNANDISGNNNNPVFNNATLTSDRLGNSNSAYHFNGTDNYMQILNSPSLNMTNQMSISVWVKPTGYYTGQCYNNMLVMKGDGDYLPGNYFLRFSDAITGCTIPTTATEMFYGTGVLATTPLVQLNQWYSAICTYDGTVAKIYINCILQGTATVSITTFTNVYDVFLGHLNNGQYPYWLNGDLDEVRIYDRALNQDEVNALGDCAPIPVKLTDFYTAVIDNKKINIVWKTAEETGITNYSVERAVSGSNDFISVGTSLPQNEGLGHSYSLIDNSAKPNILYNYRLVITDFDGSKKYSEIKTAKINNKLFYTSVYPNPSSGFVKVDINNLDGNAGIIVLNDLGQVIMTKKANPGITTNLDLTKASKGIYWVIVQSGQEKTIEKLIIH